MPKKILALSLALMLSLAAFGSFAEEEEPIHLTWTAYQLTNIDPDAIMIDYWNDFFNVDIEVWNVDNSIRDEQFSLWFASDQIPDVILNGFNLNLMSTYVRQGLLAEIPIEMLEEYMPNTLARLNAGVPNWMDICRIDGALYGLPREISFHNQFRAPLVYNGVWMDRVGVSEVPTTLEEFEDLMYKFAKEDPDQNGMDDTYGLSESGMYAVYGAFGYIPEQWKDVDGKLVYTSTLPQMKEALEVLAKWYADGVLSPDFITGENFGGYWAISNAFTEGQIGFSSHGNYYHWHGDIGIGENFNPAAMEAAMGKEYADNIRFSLPLTGPYGEGVIDQGPLFDGTQIAFGVQMEDQPEKLAKVLEMIEYWAGGDVENYLTAFYGIKGEMWDYDENGVPMLLGEWAESSEKLNAVGAHTICAPVTLVEPYAVVYKYRYDWAVENHFLEGNGTWSELFTSLPSAGTYQAELERIEDEAYIAIITGQQPIDYFDEFVAEWYAAGGEVLTQEANAWYSGS